MSKEQPSDASLRRMTSLGVTKRHSNRVTRHHACVAMTVMVVES